MCEWTTSAAVCAEGFCKKIKEISADVCAEAYCYVRSLKGLKGSAAVCTDQTVVLQHIE